MSDLTTKFLDAANRVKSLAKTPSDEDMLQLYGLYKQATIGDINISRPSFWDPKAQAKYNSWELYKTMPKEKAMASYIRTVNRLLKE
jgi:diazepam-binding inhibitor (GABA receptor modulating acyl-CoA-binding protein)